MFKMINKNAKKKILNRVNKRTLFLKLRVFIFIQFHLKLRNCFSFFLDINSCKLINPKYNKKKRYFVLISFSKHTSELKIMKKETKKQKP